MKSENSIKQDLDEGLDQVLPEIVLLRESIESTVCRIVHHKIEGNNKILIEAIMTQLTELITEHISHVDKRFDQLEARFDALENDVCHWKEDVTRLKRQFKARAAQGARC